jgi:hypothetical protein
MAEPDGRLNIKGETDEGQDFEGQTSKPAEVRDASLAKGLEE